MNNNTPTFIANIPLTISVEISSENPTDDELFQAVVDQIGRHFDQVGYTVNDLDFEKAEIVQE